MTTPVNETPQSLITLIRLDKSKGMSAIDVANKHHVSKTTVLRHCKDIKVKPLSKHLKSAEEIALIKSEYQSGKSIRELSIKHHTSKQKIAGYCTGLVKPQKEKKPPVKRIRISKKTPCPKCGALMTKNSKTCYQCYLKTKKQPNVNQKKHNKISNTAIVAFLKNENDPEPVKKPQVDILPYSQYKTNHRKPSTMIICEKNPHNLGHHWILDKDNFGVCKYCGTTKQHGVIPEVKPEK